VSAENRLTADQLAALAPGDSVTIESGTEFSRPRYGSGTVIRRTATHLVICCTTKHGGVYHEQYRLKDGIRDGGGGPAELVNLPAFHTLSTEQRQQLLRVDVLFRAWARDRTDVDKLRRLHDAISVCLDGVLVEQVEPGRRHTRRERRAGPLCSPLVFSAAPRLRGW